MKRRADKFGWLDRWILRTTAREPDFIVGGKDNPYLLRWYLLGGKWRWNGEDQKNRWVSRSILGVMRPYLHCFLRSDDDRALHDHRAMSLSFGLRGMATEHTIAAGGVHHRRKLEAGQIRFRRAKFAHRIEIVPGTYYMTLFLFFWNTREWGFHCKNGWVHWKRFVAADDPGSIGRGCGEG